MKTQSRKCRCICGGLIEFAEDAAGTIIACPHCEKEIRLPALKVEASQPTPRYETEKGTMKIFWSVLAALLVFGAIMWAVVKHRERAAEKRAEDAKIEAFIKRVERMH
ncbi:MAG: hypothetical protein WA117_21270 [Verrucomicrobiia bacterium]